MGNEPGRPGVYRAMHATTHDLGPPGPPMRPKPSRPEGAAPEPPSAARPSGGSSAPDVVSLDLSSRGPEFTDFYRTGWEGTTRALAVTLGDRDLAVEAVDEAMARAYARWSRLRHYDNPSGWVYRVALNWARSHHRRLARRPDPPPPETIHLPTTADPTVRQALMDLPVRLRSVVVCRLLLDWSVADTAAALGVRPGTVQSRLHRALRALETSLDHMRSS